MPEIVGARAVGVKARAAFPAGRMPPGSSLPRESGIISGMSLSSGAPVTAGDLLTLEELGRFRRTSPLRGAVLVLHAWATIAAAMALYALWPSPWTLGAGGGGDRRAGSSGWWCSCTRRPTGSSSRRCGPTPGSAPGSARRRWARIFARTGAGTICTTGSPSGPTIPTSSSRRRCRSSRGRFALAILARSERRHRGRRGARLAPGAGRPGGRVAPRAGAADRQRGPGRGARGDRRVVALPAHLGPAVGHVVPARDAHPEHRRARAGAGRGGPAAERAQRRRGATRAGARGALRGELPPGAPPARVRALLEAPPGARDAAGEGLRGAHGAVTQLPGGPGPRHRRPRRDASRGTRSAR